MSSPLVHRRAALIGLGALTGAGLCSNLAFAAGPSDRKLVLIILRGAMDGIAAVAPLGDPHYAGLRGSLALSPEGADAALPLKEGFALHPSFSFLQESWRDGQLAVVHAIASPYRDRSHFDGQDVLENGGAAVFTSRDGWLSRALTALPPARKAEGLAIASAMPLVLRGGAPATTWAPSRAPPAQTDTLQRLAELYSGDPALRDTLARAVETSALAQDAEMAGGQNAGQGLGRRGGPAAYRGLAEAAARLLSAPGGPAVAVLSFDGWDTHANQGGAMGGLALRFAGLDAALRALKTGMGPSWGQTAVMVVTEFGRTVAENGTRGTDHGTGSVAFVLGGAVRGGRMVGAWPGLAPASLREGRDLAAANDLRSLFLGVLEQHWGMDRQDLTRTVFPRAVAAPSFDRLIVV